MMNRPHIREEGRYRVDEALEGQGRLERIEKNPHNRNVIPRLSLPGSGRFPANLLFFLADGPLRGLSGDGSLWTSDGGFVEETMFMLT